MLGAFEASCPDCSIALVTEEVLARRGKEEADGDDDYQ